MGDNTPAIRINSLVALRGLASLPDDYTFDMGGERQEIRAKDGVDYTVAPPSSHLLQLPATMLLNQRPTRTLTITPDQPAATAHRYHSSWKL